MNPYFKRFYQYAGCNLFACGVYFLLTAVLALCGVVLDEESTSSGLLAAGVVSLAFLAALAFVTLRDKDEREAWAKSLRSAQPRTLTDELRAYLRGGEAGLTDMRTDLVTFSVWALLGALIASAGQAMGIAVYLFLAQALPCTYFMMLWGAAPGLPAGFAVSVLLFLLVRTGAVLLGRRRR